MDIHTNLLKGYVIELVDNSRGFKGKEFFAKVSKELPMLSRDELDQLVDMLITASWILNSLVKNFPEGSLNKKAVMEKLGYSPDNIAFNLAFEVFSDQRTGNLVALTGHIKIPTISADTTHVSKIFEDIFKELTK